MRFYLSGACTIAALLFLGFYFLDSNLIEFKFHRAFPSLVLFFFLQSLVVAWLIHLAEKSKWESPLYALVMITFRFLTSLFFIAVLFVLKLDDMKPLMAQFLGVYLIYLAFEIYTVLSNLRRN